MSPALPSMAGRLHLQPITRIYAMGLAAALAYAAAAQAGTGDDAVFLPLLVIFLAAAISSVAGFAFAPISAAMLVWLIGDPVRMVTVIITASIVIQGFSVWALRREMCWRGCLPFLAGGLLTLPLGLLLLLTLAGRGHALALGGMMVAYGTWMLARQPAPHRTPPRWTAVLAGAVGGLTGGLAGFPSAAVTVWGGLCGRGRAELRGVLQPFILVMQLASLVLLHLLAPGPDPAMAFDPLLLLAVPPALLGTLCGIGLYTRLSDRQFARVVNAMLIVAGLGLLA